MVGTPKPPAFLSAVLIVWFGGMIGLAEGADDAGGGFSESTRAAATPSMPYLVISRILKRVKCWKTELCVKLRTPPRLRCNAVLFNCSAASGHERSVLSPVAAHVIG